MAKKEKVHLRGMREAIRLLGWFHYLLGVFQLGRGIVMCFSGLDLFGMRLREISPKMPLFLRASSDRSLGVLAFLIVLAGAVSEFVIGWIWYRKARNTTSQLFAVSLSGIKIIRTLYTILSGNTLTTVWSSIYSLVLNGITFTLALWMQREYRRTRRNPPADPPAAGGNLYTESSGEMES